MAKEYLCQLDLNGRTSPVHVRAAEILLETLRHRFGLTGAKPGCLNGDCGACTILVDDIPVKSCIMLTVEAEGRKLRTIEGLHNAPIQKAFIEQNAFQCGYCTPGFIMNCHGLATQVPNADDHTIKEWLQSNICRCTSYQEIHAAIHSVLRADRGSGSEN